MSGIELTAIAVAKRPAQIAEQVRSLRPHHLMVPYTLTDITSGQDGLPPVQSEWHAVSGESVMILLADDGERESADRLRAFVAGSLRGGLAAAINAPGVLVLFKGQRRGAFVGLAADATPDAIHNGVVRVAMVLSAAPSPEAAERDLVKAFAGGTAGVVVSAADVAFPTSLSITPPRPSTTRRTLGAVVRHGRRYGVLYAVVAAIASLVVGLLSL